MKRYFHTYSRILKANQTKFLRIKCTNFKDLCIINYYITIFEREYRYFLSKIFLESHTFFNGFKLCMQSHLKGTEQQIYYNAWSDNRSVLWNSHSISMKHASLRTQISSNELSLHLWIKVIHKSHPLGLYLYLTVAVYFHISYSPL